MHLETRRIRWTEDRTAWTEELGQWKQARDAWEKQREDWSNQRLEAMKKIPSSSETIESASSEEEKTALKNLEAECKVLTEERDALSRKVSELNSSLESIASAKILVEKDRDFFHEQYAQASSFVGSVRAENSELEERVKIAEGQAQEGVAMIKALFETKVKAFQDDIYRWKTLAEMLQEKDTRTNDDVRERAAQATELESFCKKLLQDNASLETDLRKLGHAHQRVSMQRSKLSRKIISLTKEKAALKGRLAKFSSALEESMKPPKQNHDTSFCGDCESPDPNDMDVMPLSQSILNESSNFDDDAWFYCPWRAKDSELQCSEMFDSKEVGSVSNSASM
ncbi:hypothetical protein ID866_6421 [Astraeus odoratus]|nr:hypothetical protein ID866_6421 [Astraeus odoratus]